MNRDERKIQKRREVENILTANWLKCRDEGKFKVWENPNGGAQVLTDDIGMFYLANGRRYGRAWESMYLAECRKGILRFDGVEVVL